MLTFPYADEPLQGPVPLTLPPTATVRWRPLIPIRVIAGNGQFVTTDRALLDTGADDSIFAMKFATQMGLKLRPVTSHSLRWRGQTYALRYGDVELELSDATGQVWRWPALVAFSPAPLRYPILGNCGCLEFFDALFRGAARVVERETNPAYPGTKA
jgi:hypothetical protein